MDDPAPPPHPPRHPHAPAVFARLLLLAVLAGGGCALTAKKPPTPAARLDDAELAARPVPPGERYYLLLFGSQNAFHQAKFSHTWATLVRATCPPGAAGPAVEAHTISWLPATLDIHPFDRTVEPAANVELHATIANALATKQAVDVWGPYEVSYPFAVRFLTQKAFLDSGAIGYQCDDSIGEAARTGRGCDCIHAVSDLDPRYPRWRYPLVFYGPSATANILRRFMHSAVFLDPHTTHDWLLPRLGLADGPLRRRAYLGRAVPYSAGQRGDFDRAHLVPVPAPREPAGGAGCPCVDPNSRKEVTRACFCDHDSRGGVCVPFHPRRRIE